MKKFMSRTGSYAFLAVYKTRIDHSPSDIILFEQGREPSVSPINQGCAPSIYPTTVENFIDI